ncbi:MAG: hypothetical protein KGL39_49710 [Patescibacteria group bacterium]|nr:hypothetical protein [Patescibacteria group bacterium]
MRMDKLLLCAAACIAMAGCGGPASAGTPQPQRRVAVSGAFEGTYATNGGSAQPALVLIPSSGDGVAVDNSDYWLVPAPSADGSISGTMGFVEPPGQSTVGLSEPTFTITGKPQGNPAASISGTVADSLGGSASFSLTAFSPTQIYAGSYVGLAMGMPYEPAFTIDAYGAISETGCTTCAPAGQIQQIGASNISTLTLSGSYGNSTCSTCQSTVHGYAFMSSADLLKVGSAFGFPGPYLYLVANNSTNGIIFELIPQ